MNSQFVPAARFAVALRRREKYNLQVGWFDASLVFPGSLMAESLPGFYVPQVLVVSLKAIPHSLSMSVQ